MGLAKVLSRTRLGLDAPLVQVEVHVGAGLPSFTIVGLPAPVVRESRERVRAALQNAGFAFPAGRITVNLAPVELAKEGGRFDLPIALGVLMATGQARIPGFAFECHGELGLSGELKPVPGIFLPALHAALASRTLLLPEANVAEARLAGCARCHGFTQLAELCHFLSAPQVAAPAPVAGAAAVTEPPREVAATIDPLIDVRGQWQAKRALLIAAAGGHSLLMIGPPGSGKSMLASRLPALLPPLSVDEALTVASIHSVAGAAPDPSSWRQRPYRAPHHSASAGAIVGGGRCLAPGEISLAHHGVLFLDELPEFDRRVLESLREPLESGTITLARASSRLALPAEFQLLAAMNPCPCGYLGDAERACRCTPTQVARYRARLSGPLLDRIDLCIEVPRVAAQELLGPAAAAAPPATPALREPALAVARARARQRERSQCLNARLTARAVAEHCSMEHAAEALLLRSREQWALSARAVHRVLRVARTIADLEPAAAISSAHLAEALQLRREAYCNDTR